LVIRNFDLAHDYQAVLTLWRASAPGVHVGTSDTPEEIGKKLARDPDLFLVAEDAGQVVGVVMGGFDGRRGLVYHLAVAPAHRGRDLGAALMAELEARLKAQGCRKVYLLIRPDNAGVMDFYRKLGWAEMPVHVMGKEIR
jgi:ribosomal protein S18 acetylase RimI-like enzyme